MNKFGFRDTELIGLIGLTELSCNLYWQILDIFFPISTDQQLGFFLMGNYLCGMYLHLIFGSN